MTSSWVGPRTNSGSRGARLPSPALSARYMISRTGPQRGPFAQNSAGCRCGIDSSIAPARSISSRQIRDSFCITRSPSGR